MHGTTNYLVLGYADIFADSQQATITLRSAFLLFYVFDTERQMPRKQRNNHRTDCKASLAAPRVPEIGKEDIFKNGKIPSFLRDWSRDAAQNPGKASQP